MLFGTSNASGGVGLGAASGGGILEIQVNGNSGNGVSIYNGSTQISSWSETNSIASGSFQIVANGNSAAVMVVAGKISAGAVGQPSVAFGNTNGSTYNGTGAGTQYVAWVGNTLAGTGNSTPGNAQFNPTSGATNFVALAIAPVINQNIACTGSYTALKIVAAEVSLASSPSSTPKLIDCYSGAAGTTAEFSVSNKGTVTQAGGQIMPVNTQTGASYTPLVTDYYVIFTYAGAVAVTLNSSLATGTVFKIKNKTGVGNSVTLTPTASALIDGSANLIMSTNNQAVEVVWDGTAWNVF